MTPRACSFVSAFHQRLSEWWQQLAQRLVRSEVALPLAEMLIEPRNILSLGWNVDQVWRHTQFQVPSSGMFCSCDLLYPEDIGSLQVYHVSLEQPCIAKYFLANCCGRQGLQKIRQNLSWLLFGGTTCGPKLHFENPCLKVPYSLHVGMPVRRVSGMVGLSVELEDAHFVQPLGL